MSVRYGLDHAQVSQGMASRASGVVQVGRKYHHDLGSTNKVKCPSMVPVNRTEFSMCCP